MCLTNKLKLEHRGGDYMTKKEKEFLDSLKVALPKMSEAEKERLLIFGEAIGMIADKREPPESDQKPA